MKTYKDVSSGVYPISPDLESSPTTVYVRDNIREELREQQDGSQILFYVYDEVQYTREEWEAMQ